MTTGSSGPTPLSPDRSASYQEVVCKIARPIRWSERDTPETIRGVKEHNAVFKSLCGSQGKPSENQ